MTGETKKTAAGKTAVGLLWSAARKNGQAVLLRQKPEGIQFLSRETVSESSLPEWLHRLSRSAEDGQAPVTVTIGMDSSQVGFYMFDVPSVQEPQLTSLVRTQAEGCLPLPVSAMRLAWRVDPAEPSDRCVLAAVRNEVYQQTVSRFSEMELHAVIPDTVGLLACWHECFQSSRQKTVVLTLGASDAVAILTEYGRILNAVRIDVDPEGPAQLLVGDLLQALHALAQEVQKLDVFLLEGASNRFPSLAEDLNKEGFHVQVSAPDPQKAKLAGSPGSAVIRDYPEAIGLAVLGLREQTADFDFTRQRTGPVPTARQQMFSAPVLRMVLSMILAIVIGVLGLYWKDKLELHTLQQKLTEEEKGQTAQKLLQQLEYRRQVAQSRPDLLELLDILRQALPEGLLLDQFTFERGKPVDVRGAAQSYEQAYEFQKNLQKRSDIRQVQLVEPTFDDKTKKINFTIRFLYRNFSG